MNSFRTLTILLIFAVIGPGLVPSKNRAENVATLNEAIKFQSIAFVSSAGESVDAEMGWLVVPENRSRPQGNTIRLPVVRFKSTARNPGYPIIYLAGGPGASGLTTAKGVTFPLFMALRERADVIVFDQRGTGAAEPSLVASGNFDLPLGAPLDDPDSHKQLLDKTKKAAAEIRSRGIDLSAYNTEENAADVNDLRLALGADKMMIWGHSYGSHLGLAVLKRYRQFVSKAILGGINGPDQRWRYPNDLERLVERVDDQIKGIPKLQRKMPSLKKTVASVLRRLTEKPVVVQLTSQPVTIGRKDVEVITALQAGEWEFVKNLPQFFGRMQDGDFSGVAQMIVGGLKTREIGTAMRYSMHITSGVSPERAATIAQQQKTALFGNAINFPFDDKEFREAWAVADLGAAYRAPVKTDVPTLFLSGTLDGRTSIADAEEVRRGFDHSELLIIDGAAHDFYHLTPKVLAAMLDFLDDKTVPTRISLPVEFRGPDERKLVLELRQLFITKGVEAGVKRLREMNDPKSESYLTTYVIGTLGTILSREDKLPRESFAVFKAGVELFPDNAFLNERLAEAYAAAGQKDLALTFYKRCLELNPMNRVAYLKVKQLS